MEPNTYILDLGKTLFNGTTFQLIATLILCFILSKLLYKPVLNFLSERKKRIEEDINNASKKLGEADTLKIEYESKLKDIEKERITILEDARALAKKNEAEILEDARKEAENIKNRALLEIEREQEKVKEEIKLQIIEVSSLVASKFINQKIGENEQNELIENAISDLGEIEWKN